MFPGGPEPPRGRAAVVGGAAGVKFRAAPCQVKRTWAQRKFFFVCAPSVANVTQENDAPRDKSSTNASGRNGNLGRGTCYRLGEVLCGFYTLVEDETGTDVEDDVVFPL